jgi:class 3 adenylate cyclase
VVVSPRHEIREREISSSPRIVRCIKGQRLKHLAFSVNQFPLNIASSHPPDSLWAEEERCVETTWATELSSKREALWPLLSDTSSLNEQLGLPEMNFVERDGNLYGSFGRGLLRQEWVEVPWEWEAAKWLVAERRYSKGPALAVRVRYLLDDHKGGTKLTVRVSWIARYWWSRPVLRYINRWLRAQYERVLRELDDLTGNPIQERLPPESRSDVRVDQNRLRSAIKELTEGEVSSADVDRLANFIRTGSDQQLFRIRPKQLGFEWGMELEDLLLLLLRATRAGLLRLSWDLMCPHCQGVRKESRSLGDLREFGRCDVCNIDFAASGLESIEVTFRVLSEVRVVSEVFYCSAEPAKKPHILLQHRLEPGESYETELGLAPGRYRLRRAVGEGARVSFEIGKAQGGEESLVWNTTDLSLASPRSLAPKAKFVLRNPETQSVPVVLEKVVEDPAALRPHELFNFQQFRDLFSEESITSGLKLEVGHQTLLFTDIVGSTRLYADLGDTRAFNFVHSHFVSLQKIVGAKRGAVVKTIGDAMMAAFQRPEDAFAAAIEIQEKFVGGDDEPLRVRAALHRGICLAVRLESNIDYFGQAVNYAAKMQSVAGAGEIALSNEFHAQPGIAEHLRASGLEVEEVNFPSVYRNGNETSTVMVASLPRQKLLLTKPPDQKRIEI